MKELLRTQRENKVLEHIRVTDAGMSAKLIVDQSHPFFYDHPLDHVPGLLLIEGATQLATAWLSEQVPVQEQYLTQLSIRFIKFALHEDDILLSLSEQRDGKLLVIVSQTGVERARLVFGFCDEISRLAGCTPFLGSKSKPANATRLNKHNPANVMIAEPTQTKAHWGTSLLAPSQANSLQDTQSAQHWHPLALLESYMQLLRFQNSAPGARQEKKRMRDILCGIEFKLNAQVQCDWQIDVSSAIEQIPDQRFLRRVGTLKSGPALLGEVAILTARLGVAKTQTQEKMAS